MVIYDTVLIRYGELTTKGKNRRAFDEDESIIRNR